MFSILSLETWSLLALLFTLLLVYGTRPYGFFKNLGIPGPKPLPFLGSFLSYRIGIHNFDMENFRKYGKVWGIFDGRLPIMMFADPEMVKAVLVKECYTYFTNRREMKMWKGPMDEAITVVKDEKWRRIRSTLSPFFTSGRLKEMFPILEQYGDSLIDYLKKRNPKESVQMKEVLGPYSMDVITSTSFSVETDAINNPNDPFIKNIKEMFKINFHNPALWIILLFPSVAPLMQKLGFGVFKESVMEFFHNALKKIMDQHHKDHSSRVDFLRLMTKDRISEEQAKKHTIDQPIKGLTDKEILSQSLIFILGGYETTSTTLTNLMYNLATNPDTMKKLVEEIDAVFPDNAPVTYEDLMKLEYLEMVINESQRLIPTAPRLERVCKEAVEINGISIPANTLVGFSAYVLHHDPQLWTSPELFWPERFSKENKESINPYAFLPFGLGPRNCIAMRFALMNMRMVVVKLFQNFTLETCKETQIPLEFTVMYQLTVPVTLKLVPRSHIIRE